jgi:hypothetical protein
MASFLDLEEIEDTDELQIKALKPRLRFRIGDTVFLKGDTRQKCPLTVTSYIFYEAERDYVVQWANNQNGMEKDFLPDKALCPQIETKIEPQN